MKILVFSHHHGLLPFAHRLKREGHEVDVVVWNNRFARAWEGKLDKLTQGKPTAELLAPQLEMARAGELVVMTDSLKGQEMFAESRFLYGVPHTIPFAKPPGLCLSGWFRDGQMFASRLLVPDWGLWPGGLGASVLGGCTTIPTHIAPALPDTLADALQKQHYTGLLVVGYDYQQASNELVPIGFTAGWPFLFSHLFISQLQNFGELLSGGLPDMNEVAFEVALPVSQPPWPIQGAPGAEPQPLTGLSNEIARQCFFHDLALKGSEVWTAGLDGLVAVVRGSGASLGSAQMKALEVARALPLAQKQFRMDVGGKVGAALIGLEYLGYL